MHPQLSLVRSVLLLALAWVCLSPAVRASPPRSVEVAIFEGGEGLTFFLEAARDFERLHPGTRIHLYGDPRISDKLRVRVLEGNLPEITNANLNYRALEQAGQLYDLGPALDGPALDAPTTWRDSFLPGSLDRFTRGRSTYAVPLIYTVWAGWYNRELFARHGWKPPTTWSEFFALSGSVKAAGLAPVAFQGRYTYYAQPLIDNTYYQLAGAQEYARLLTLQPGSLDNPNMVQALSLVSRLARQDLQPGALGMSHTEAQLEFFQGRAAMIFCGSWLKSEMLENIPDGFHLGTFRLPLPDGPQVDPEALMVGPGYYFVFSQSPSPAAGAEFLRFLTSRRVAARLARERDITVAVRGANQALSPDLQELGQLVDSARRTFPESHCEDYPQMQEAWSQARFELLSGRSTPEQVARQLEEAAEGLRWRRAHPGSTRYRHLWKPALLSLFLTAGLAWLMTRPANPTTTATRRLRGSTALALVGPGVLLYLSFFLGPALLSLAWSLTRWDGINPMQWVGLGNFRHLLFESDTFWIALGNNLYLMLLVPALVVPLALLLAACLRSGLGPVSLFRTGFFLPTLLGMGGILLWQQLYHPSGPINRLIGLRDFPWLSQEHLYLALLPMSVWGAAGFYMLLFESAMRAVPPELYAAAELDGASPWARFWHITLPLVWDTLVVALVFLVIAAMKSFEAIWLLTNQEPTRDTHVIGTLLVSTLFSRSQVGEATALAVLLLALVTVLSLVAQRGLEREAHEL